MTAAAEIPTDPYERGRWAAAHWGQLTDRQLAMLEEQAADDVERRFVAGVRATVRARTAVTS